MKRCELCTNVARMYCQSDNASLCYDCDQNVHSANFLVAKHSRTLLCHKCQSPTPWNASGLNLGRTASVCDNCLHEGGTSHRGNDVVEENCVLRDDLRDDLREEGDGETDDDDTEHSDENEGEDEDEDENENEDAENQVVPWSIMASLPTTASSSSEEFSSSRFSSDDTRSGTKRERLDAYIDSEDDTVCSSERFNSKPRTEIDDAISLRSFRPF